MTRPATLALSLALIQVACGDSTSTSLSEGTDTSTGAATGEPSTSDTSTGDAGTTDATTSPTTGATSEGTTGDLAYCYGWGGPDGEPHLELQNNGVPVVEGGELTLECGGQGLFMFGLYPTFGGFTPASDSLIFDVLVDVPGHNTAPGGHFYSSSYSYYIGCEDLIGGTFGVVPILPPDSDDPLTLDGLPATVKVILQTGDVPVTLDFAVTLAVDANDSSFEFCGQG